LFITKTFQVELFDKYYFIYSQVFRVSLKKAQSTGHRAQALRAIAGRGLAKGWLRGSFISEEIAVVGNQRLLSLSSI